MPEPIDTEAHAKHLRMIARDLRMAGDLMLVQVTEDGMEEAGVTLADELWLIAAALDPGRMFEDSDPDR